MGKTKKSIQQKRLSPGLNGQNKRKKPSDFGIQLMAKQKLKCHYGYITEKQFRNLLKKLLRLKVTQVKT